MDSTQERSEIPKQLKYLFLGTPIYLAFLSPGIYSLAAYAMLMLADSLVNITGVLSKEMAILLIGSD